MLLTCDSFIYRAVRPTVVIMTNYAAFEFFYYDVPMFIACIIVKLIFNVICSWLVTLYFASSHFSVTYHFLRFHS